MTFKSVYELLHSIMFLISQWQIEMLTKVTVECHK